MGALPSSITGSVLSSSSPTSSSVPDTADALANTAKSSETTKTQAAGSNAGTAAPTNSSVWSCASSNGQTTTVGGTQASTPTAVASTSSDVDEDRLAFIMYAGFGAVIVVMIIGIAILALQQRATHARLGAQKRREAEEAAVPGKGTWSEEETVVAASARYGGGAAAVPASSEPVTAANVSDPSISSALSSSSRGSSHGSSRGSSHGSSHGSSSNASSASSMLSSTASEETSSDGGFDEYST